jgi:hypothetical protein
MVPNLLSSPLLYFTKLRKIQVINSSFHFCCLSNPVNENFSHVKKCCIYFLCTSAYFSVDLARCWFLTSLRVSAVCRKINTWTHEYRRFVSTLLRIQQFTQIMLYKHTLVYRKEACVPCSLHSKAHDKLTDMYTRTKLNSVAVVRKRTIPAERPPCRRS